MTARVSVLVAAYNAERYIKDTIDSVLQQTFDDWELIIVDDGSLDHTADLVGEMAAKDERIKLIRQPNSGAQIARNVAFAASSGDYIVILDADDRLLPEKLTKQVSLLDENIDVGLVYGDTWHCDDQMERICLESNKYPGQHVSGDVYERIILGNLFAVHAAMVRRTFILKVGLHDPDPDLIGDWDLWVRVAEVTRFLYHPEPVAEYRFHAGMSAKCDAARKQFRQRMGVVNKIIKTPRFLDTDDKIQSAVFYYSARFAYKFGLLKEAFFLSKKSFNILPLFPGNIILLAVIFFKKIIGFVFSAQK